MKKIFEALLTKDSGKSKKKNAEKSASKGEKLNCDSIGNDQHHAAETFYSLSF